MNRLYPILLFLLSISVISCTDYDDFVYDEETEESSDEQNRNKEEKKELNVNLLIIGNSLSRDAFSYVPYVMKSVYPTLNIDMRILYISGKPLSTHWDYIKGKKEYTLDSYDNDNDFWSTKNGVLADNVLLQKKWDLIIFQEGSINAREYILTQPYVSQIKTYIQSIQNDISFAYMIIPSLPDGAISLGLSSSDDVWKMNALTAKALLDNNYVDYIIPCGTSIQNARHTYLDGLGVFGHLSYDGRHLQEGIPCLIEAYTAAQSLFNFYSINASILNCGLVITQKWINNCKIPGQHGQVVEGNDDAYELSKLCALAAINSPYVIVSQ